MGRLEISVAMCTYNGSRYLREQLESIAAQTRLPDELIICDDRSTDETPETLEKFTHQATFAVRVEFNQNNLGSTGNFENAIRRCQGRIIVLADQDDVWHPHKLSRISEVFDREKDVGAVFSDAELIDANSRPLAKTLWNSVSFNSREQDKFEDGGGLEVMLKHPVVTGATMAFRRDFKDLVLPIPSSQIHDHWIALLIASVSQLAPIRDLLIQYRKHAAQQIGAGNIDSLWQLTQVSRRMSRDFYLGEVERFNEISERLRCHIATFRPHQQALRMIQEKINHRKTRGSFPSSKVLRLPSLVREVATFRYWRYSNGLGSVAKDLLV